MIPAHKALEREAKFPEMGVANDEAWMKAAEAARFGGATISVGHREKSNGLLIAAFCLCIVLALVAMAWRASTRSHRVMGPGRTVCVNPFHEEDGTECPCLKIEVNP